MEEDRERHKRLREDIWIRPADETGDAEFEQAWVSTADLDDYDYEVMMLENLKYRPRYPWAEMLDGQEEIEIQVPPTPPPIPMPPPVLTPIPRADAVKRGTDEGLNGSKDDGGPDAKRVKVEAQMETTPQFKAEEKSGNTSVEMELEPTTTVQEDEVSGLNDVGQIKPAFIDDQTRVDLVQDHENADSDVVDSTSQELSTVSSSQWNSESSTQVPNNSSVDSIIETIQTIHPPKEIIGAAETLEPKSSTSIEEHSAIRYPLSQANSCNKVGLAIVKKIGEERSGEQDVEMVTTQDEDNRSIEMAIDEAETIGKSGENTEDAEAESPKSISTVSTVIMEREHISETPGQVEEGVKEHDVSAEIGRYSGDEHVESEASKDIEMNVEEVRENRQTECHEKAAEAVVEEEDADDEVVLVFTGGPIEGMRSPPRSPGQASNVSTISSLSTLSDEEPLFGEPTPPSTSVAPYHLTYAPREIVNGRNIFVWDLDETLISMNWFLIKVPKWSDGFLG
ncbi:hypothetical protein BC936DRAFT_138998 [Jimgerdemannia flammicorona]|uniref:CTD kinase subunit gamma Ctk3 C-terminal domain-containing protein n=1 Tax=Jimgerdemannia flammicorona TaxID=994334 RepID=A0A433BAZ9_9FUNG|nr:hypothetical protein BC936DRAFT_138998 [Jimgerdemannia flammicorona]